MLEGQAIHLGRMLQGDFDARLDQFRRGFHPGGNAAYQGHVRADQTPVLFQPGLASVKGLVRFALLFLMILMDQGTEIAATPRPDACRHPPGPSLGRDRYRCNADGIWGSALPS